MSQEHASSALLIYDTLTADSTFMSYVGNRVFKNNNTSLDAISIITPGEDLPAIKSVSGLEVIIHDVGQLAQQKYVTEDYEIMTTWKVFLLAWQGANGTTLNNAARRIMERFSNAYTLETNPAPSGLGSIAQLLTLIPSNSVIR